MESSWRPSWESVGKQRGKGPDLQLPCCACSNSASPGTTGYLFRLYCHPKLPVVKDFLGVEGASTSGKHLNGRMLRSSTRSQHSVIERGGLYVGLYRLACASSPRGYTGEGHLYRILELG